MMQDTFTKDETNPKWKGNLHSSQTTRLSNIQDFPIPSVCVCIYICWDRSKNEMGQLIPKCE